MTASDAPPGTQAEHHVRIDWHEPGSRVAYDLNGDIDGEWTGPRIRLPAIDAWWARGAGPPDAGRMPGLAGETVVIHADGERQVYVLKDWHPGREFPGVASDGYFDAEWPDLPPLLLAVHLVPGCPQRLCRGKGNRIVLRRRVGLDGRLGIGGAARGRREGFATLGGGELGLATGPFKPR